MTKRSEPFGDDARHDDASDGNLNPEESGVHRSDPGGIEQTPWGRVADVTRTLQRALARMTIRAIDPVQGTALDADLIDDRIGAAALCADCLSRITGLSSSRLNEALPSLIGALRVASTLAVCGICLRQRIVHRKE